MVTDMVMDMVTDMVKKARKRKNVISDKTIFAYSVNYRNEDLLIVGSLDVHASCED